MMVMVMMVMMVMVTDGENPDVAHLPKELLLILLQLLRGDVAKLSILPDLVRGTSAHWRPVQVQAWLLEHQGYPLRFD